MRLRLGAFALLVMLLVGIASAPTALAGGSIDWTGQGATGGVPDTTDCSDLGAGQILFVLTGTADVTSATITANGVTYDATSQQGNNIHFIVDATQVSSASVAYEGVLSDNAQLVISHGCPEEVPTVPATVPATMAPTVAPTTVPTVPPTVAPTVPATVAPTTTATEKATETATAAPEETSTVTPPAEENAPPPVTGKVTKPPAAAATVPATVPTAAAAGEVKPAPTATPPPALPNTGGPGPAQSSSNIWLDIVLVLLAVMISAAGYAVHRSRR